jgi:hypothetical protein
MSRHRKSDTLSELQWLGRVLSSPRLWIIVAWIGTFAVIAKGLHKLDPIVRQIKDGDTRIVWVGVPDWLQTENWRYLLDDLEHLVNLNPDTDPYDDRVCPWVAETLSASPWISQVRKVSKQLDGQVRVYADFRRPYAAIEHDGMAYLIDEVGVRLPEQWPAYAVNRGGWLVLRGVKAATPELGQRWVGQDVVAGLKLVSFMYRAELAQRLPFRKEIHAIDVGNFDGKRDRRAGRLQLITKNPESYIHWGLPPGEEYGIESTAEAKIAMLTTLFNAAGCLPDQGPIDVRTENLIGIGSPE